VATHELLTVHLGVPVTDRACRRLRRVMRELGWRGPRLMRWGGKTLKGYWRHPTVGLPAIVQEGALAEVETVEGETLAPQLAAATRLALEKMTQILKIPTDRGDGNLLRAQIGAAGLAVNVQMRVDEARLKQVRSRDIMERIRAMLAEEEAKLAEEKRLERGKEGAAAAQSDILGAEDSRIDIMPSQDAKDRA
jgi:hypothetical protein